MTEIFSAGTRHSGRHVFRAAAPAASIMSRKMPAARESRATSYFDHGPKGGMSLLGLSGKAGARFSKNDLMPSCASAPAAR